MSLGSLGSTRWEWNAREGRWQCSSFRKGWEKEVELSNIYVITVDASAADYTFRVEFAETFEWRDKIVASSNSQHFAEMQRKVEEVEKWLE